MGSCFSSTPKHIIRYVDRYHPITSHPPPNNSVPNNPNLPSEPTVPNQPAPRNALGPTNDICFHHILEGLYDAALKAQTNVQMNHLHQFFWFFPRESDGTHRARMVRIKVPGPNGEENEIDIPYFNLIQQNYLTIHEIKLKTKLDMEMTVMPDVSEVHESLPKTTYYRIDLIPGDKSTDLELTMRLDPSPEAIQRLLHKFDVKL